MVCPPVRGYNPQSLSNGLSYEQVDGHGITFYSTLNCADLAHFEYFFLTLVKVVQVNLAAVRL